MTNCPTCGERVASIFDHVDIDCEAPLGAEEKGQAMGYIIEADVDRDYLVSLKDRLFSERRMSGDEMRDAGNRLTILLDRLIPIEERPYSPCPPEPASAGAEEERTATIAALNDAFRTVAEFPSWPLGGRVLITSGINALAPRERQQIVAAVRDFSDFGEDNDPHGEHDFGAVEVAGHRCFWKIDYYDPTIEFGSDDPTDPEKTTRVLTIMLAEEY